MVKTDKKRQVDDLRERQMTLLMSTSPDIRRRESKDSQRRQSLAISPFGSQDRGPGSQGVLSPTAVAAHATPKFKSGTHITDGAGLNSIEAQEHTIESIAERDNEFDTSQ